MECNVGIQPIPSSKRSPLSSESTLARSPTGADTQHLISGARCDRETLPSTSAPRDAIGAASDFRRTIDRRGNACREILVRFERTGLTSCLTRSRSARAQVEETRDLRNA